MIVEGEGMIPRSLWKLGRVEKLRKSRDGEIRELSSKLIKMHKRPIKKLYPLEVNYESKTAEQEGATTEVNDNGPVRRPLKNSGHRRKSTTTIG